MYPRSWAEAILEDVKKQPNWTNHPRVKREKVVQKYKKTIPLYIKRGLDEPRPVCPYCGKLIKSHRSIDHIVPRSKGGTDDPDNLVLCHLKCNVEKWDNNLLEFMVKKVNGQKTSPFV